ncbi:unnamed protein product [Moneuplotes crassus]|uniref:Potassium channel domain-containing protein n=1 Tax=Euplotes crassus TaxID=5936 RepID=A0AAD1U9L5_EUPCR|nr:unnamed protein product [Moneuplotes crassus]
MSELLFEGDNRLFHKKTGLFDNNQKATNDTNSKNSSDIPLIKKSTVFQEIQEEIRREHVLPGAGHPMHTGKALSRYNFAIYCSGVLALISIGFCVVEHECLLKYGQDEHSDYRLLILGCHLLTTIALAINIVITNKCWIWWRKTLGLIGIHDDLINTKTWKIMILEIALNFISPMPFFYKVQYEDYYYVDGETVRLQLNTMLMLLMVIIRIYHAKRCYLISTEFMTDRANRVCPIYGVRNGYRYCIRAVFKKNPFVFCYANYAFYTIVFGYMFYHIENEANDGNIGRPYFTFQNSVWCSFITMTTVGYGDFYPKTILGRFLGYCSAFVGVALESLVILSFQTGFLLRNAELSAYIMLDSLRKKEKLKERAGRMLVAQYRLQHSTEKTRSKYLKKLRLCFIA